MPTAALATTSLGLALVLAPIAMFAYAYLGYPLLLKLVTRRRVAPRGPTEPSRWPTISIVVPAYNAERTIGRTIERLLAADYPADRRQILIVSDGSTDGTDDVVRGYAGQGVELLRVPRAGKQAAELKARPHVRGEIVVSTDASIVVPPEAIKLLVRHFADPTVGVVSGRCVSVANHADATESTRADGRYLGYEMWVRSMETHLGSAVGAAGGLYASRREVFNSPISWYATRDFASALIAAETGLRTIQEDQAVCYVGRSASIRAEFRRKVRTMVNGLDTTWDFRHQLDPRVAGTFAMMTWSHKMCRWLVFLLAPLAIVGLLLLAPQYVAARALLALAALGILTGWRSVHLAERGKLPTVLALSAYAVVTASAGALAWLHFFRRRHATTWEPTRRTA